ncbi:MAG: sugar transferase, partial [Deltaproteobacteria bacterium]
MLKRHSQFFESLLFITDIVIIVASWIFSYYLRFHSGLISIDKGVPPLKIYILLVLPIIFIWGFVFKSFGLYRPRRIASHAREIFDITKACAVSILVLIAVTFVYRQYEFSRLVFLFFGAINVVALSIERWVFREVLRYLRKKGHNLRYALIVGTGDMSKEILKRIDTHPEVGLKVVGLLSTNKYQVGANVHGIEVLGVYDEVGRFVKEKGIDNVIIALAWEEHGKVIDVLKNIGEEMVDIQVIPDIYEFATIRGGIEEFDGLPIISLQDSPLYGWNMVIKRSFDVLFSIIAVILTVPVMLIVAVAIKLTSHGPIFYRQERMSIGGDTFQMLKFRSMKIDAEQETGAVWAKMADPRRTWFGTFLRKTSLD